MEGGPHTLTHILFSYMTPQRQHRLLHYMINIKVSPAPAVGARLSYAANNTRAKALTAADRLPRG